jgi:hypothetical protein
VSKQLILIKASSPDISGHPDARHHPESSDFDVTMNTASGLKNIKT